MVFVKLCLLLGYGNNQIIKIEFNKLFLDFSIVKICDCNGGMKFLSCILKFGVYCFFFSFQFRIFSYVFL